MSPESWHMLAEIGAVVGSTAGSFVGSFVASWRTRHLIRRQDPSIAYTARVVAGLAGTLDSDPPPRPPLDTLDEPWDNIMAEAARKKEK